MVKKNLSFSLDVITIYKNLLIKMDIKTFFIGERKGMKNPC